MVRTVKDPSGPNKRRVSFRRRFGAIAGGLLAGVAGVFGVATAYSGTALRTEPREVQEEEEFPRRSVGDDLDQSSDGGLIIYITGQATQQVQPTPSAADNSLLGLILPSAVSAATSAAVTALVELIKDRPKPDKEIRLTLEQWAKVQATAEKKAQEEFLKAKEVLLAEMAVDIGAAVMRELRFALDRNDERLLSMAGRPASAPGPGDLRIADWSVADARPSQSVGGAQHRAEEADGIFDRSGAAPEEDGADDDR